MREVIKPEMMDYKRHMIVCVGSRCTQGSGQALYDILREKFEAVGLNKGDLRVKRSRATCFGTCKSGPLVCVQPDGVWYYNVTEMNLDRIVEQHLLGGKPVEDLIYHRGPGLKNLSHEPTCG